jgi:hypothetical protein
MKQLTCTRLTALTVCALSHTASAQTGSTKTAEKVKHYGLTDAKEYFAEGTEAYLYRNDFYPFVRAELKEHDPALHDVLLQVWGPAD